MFVGRVRRARLAVVALGVAVVLSACGGADEDDAAQDGASPAAGGTASSPADAGSGSEDGWSFTDDTGRTVTLDAPPERVAGYADEAAALWGFGIEPVAVFGYLPLADDIQFEPYDVNTIEEVGSAYGEINVEALAAAQPDIIVTTAYPDEEVHYGFADQAQVDAIEEIAPIVAIEQSGSAEDVIARNAELAEALGADLDSAEMAQAEADFEAAGEALGAAGERGIRVVTVAAYEGDGVYFARASDDPALSYYESLGVNFVPIEGGEYYWHQVSWENVDIYPADMVLYSLRALGPEGMQEQPTFAALPLAQADQLYPWKFMGLNWADQAAYMNELAEWIGAAEPTDA